ncbi:MAG: hypothetical protein NTX00_01035 [Candidatus Parcubacteria bacterium]|nr:hypothetical protein [Candidatus Parcubacteria bacterium]
MSEATLNLIKTSFLSKSAKEQLIDFFNNYGATDAFYQKFDVLLMDELKTRNENFTSIINSYDKEAEDLEKKFLIAKESLDARIKDSLSAVDKLNINEKNKIWDAYYSDIANLENDFDSQLKNIIAKEMVKNM